MKELVLVGRSNNRFYNGFMCCCGFLVSVFSLMALYNRTYLFFHFPHEYKNRKTFYKWLLDGNEPTRGKFFKLYPTWNVGDYRIRLFLNNVFSVTNIKTGEVLITRFNPSDVDKRMYNDIISLLCRLKKSKKPYLDWAVKCSKLMDITLDEYSDDCEDFILCYDIGLTPKEAVDKITTEMMEREK